MGVTLCKPRQIERYMSRISGPLLDRIDIHIEVPAVPFRELSGGSPGTSSAAMREQVKAARARQTARFDGSPTRHNAHMSHRQTRQFCPLDDECRDLLKAAMSELGLSARRTTRCCASRGRSPTSTPARPFARITSTRRSTTACSTGRCGREGFGSTGE